jgi:hypothetical protein
VLPEEGLGSALRVRRATGNHEETLEPCCRGGEDFHSIVSCLWPRNSLYLRLRAKLLAYECQPDDPSTMMAPYMVKYLDSKSSSAPSTCFSCGWAANG